MKHSKIFIVAVLLLTSVIGIAQNVGIGTNTPTEKLEVSGKTKTNGLVITTGGNQYDILIKNTATGEVGFKHAMGGIGLNYIICLSGMYPSPGGGLQQGPLTGEIKLFAGTWAPAGWAICNGQIMSIAQNTALFSILGTSFGGNGQTTFALPDLRGTVAVGYGTAPAGYNWDMGEKRY